MAAFIPIYEQCVPHKLIILLLVLETHQFV